MARLVAVKKYYDPEEAVIAFGCLCAYGLHPELMGYHHLAMNPALRVGLQGYILAVPDPERSDALALLDDNQALEPNTQKPGRIKCAACATSYFKERADLASFVTALYVGAPFVGKIRAAHCPNCGAEAPYAVISRRWRRHRWMSLVLLAICFGAFLATGVISHLFNMQSY